METMDSKPNLYVQPHKATQKSRNPLMQIPSPCRFAPVQKATNVLLREKNSLVQTGFYTPIRSTYCTNVTVCVTILKRMVGAYSACKVDSHMHV